MSYQSSWTRRFSHPSQSSYVPALPTVSSLRAALLKYLGEVEAALRDQPQSSNTGSSRGCGSGLIGGAEENVQPADNPSSSDDASLCSASSSAWQPQKSSSQITRRGTHQETYPLLPKDPPPTLQQNQPIKRSNQVPHQTEPQVAPLAPSDALAHLNSLRADVLAYVHQGLSHREWLQSLPSRLSLVDLGLGENRMAAGAAAGMQAARQRVMQLVKGLLPLDDWAGWERLGWEDNNGSTSLVFHDDDEEDISEPEYLFPNRTPASARAVAFASMRRARSKSLGDASISAAQPSTVFFPARITRTRTEPYSGHKIHRRIASYGAVHSRNSTGKQRETVSEDEKGDASSQEGIQGVEKRGRVGAGRDGEVEGVSDTDSVLDDDCAEDILSHPELSNTKLTRLVASAHAGPTVEQALKTSKQGTKLIEFEDLPFWWRNNQYIITGYRFIPLHEKTGPIPLIKSAFSFHNETVNIHSHFLPTLFILACIPVIIWSSPLPNAHWLDTTMLVFYLLAAISCLLSSAGWHVLSGCASRNWFEWGACVDYIGISWLIAMSFNTVVYNAYYCHPKTALFYIFTNLACGALGSVLPFQRWFNERKSKKYRIAFFLFLCFAMFSPMVQMLYQEGLQRGLHFCAPFGRSVVSYVTGLIFYGFHFPECVRPGCFDHWGASHQIWHIGIVIAIILHYQAIFVAHEARLSYSCAAADAGSPVTKLVDGLLGWL